MASAAQPVTTSGHPPAGTSPESQERADRLQPLHRRSLLISLPHMRQRGVDQAVPVTHHPQQAKPLTLPSRGSLYPREHRDPGEDGLWQCHVLDAAGAEEVELEPTSAAVELQRAPAPGVADGAVRVEENADDGGEYLMRALGRRGAKPAFPGGLAAALAAPHPRPDPFPR